MEERIGYIEAFTNGKEYTVLILIVMEERIGCRVIYRQDRQKPVWS